MGLDIHRELTDRNTRPGTTFLLCAMTHCELSTSSLEWVSDRSLKDACLSDPLLACYATVSAVAGDGRKGPCHFNGSVGS